MRNLAALVVAIGVVGLFVGALRPDRGSRTVGETVLTVRVVPRSFAIVVRTVGELDAARSTVVVTPTRGNRGKIGHVIDEGAQVNAGDVLVRLDPTPFEDELRRLRGEQAKAQAAVAVKEQLRAWEGNQAEQEVQAAEYELRVARLEKTKLELGDGPLELGRLEGELQAAKQAWSEKRDYLQDIQDLQGQGFADPAEVGRLEREVEEVKRQFDLKRLQFTTYRDFVLPSLLRKSEAQVTRAEMVIEQREKARVFRVGRADAELEQTRREVEVLSEAVAEAQLQIEKAVILAPISGLVVLPEQFFNNRKRKPQIGDTVWEGQPLVYLPDISHLVVNASIREVDLHKVQVGMPVAVLVDAYPDLRLSGRVQGIGVMAETPLEERSREKRFQLRVAVNGSDPGLRPGMSVEIEVLCGEAVGVLAVPPQALFRELDRVFCYRLEDGGFSAVVVETGLRSEDLVEITSGLGEGDRIALSAPPPGTLRTGGPAETQAGDHARDR